MKPRELKDKMPKGEWAYVWLYRLAYGIYPRKVYDDAYRTLTLNIDESGFPHFLAMTAIYMSCVHNNEEISIKKCHQIMNAYHGQIWWPDASINKYGPTKVAVAKTLVKLKRRARKWKLEPT